MNQFNGAPLRQAGTPVPKAAVETGTSFVARVVTYTLSPEELARRRAEWDLEREREERFQAKKRAKLLKLTKDEYLVERISGKNRTNIAKEHGTPYATFHHQLKKWDLVDPIAEEAAMEEIKQRLPGVPEMGTPTPAEVETIESDAMDKPDNKVEQPMPMTISVNVPVDPLLLTQILNSLIYDVHQIATDHGWHDESVPFPQAVALIHSELSEALQADRKHEGNERIEEELADVVIRVMDTAATERLDLAGALLTKMNKNRTREHRHGGLKY